MAGWPRSVPRSWRGRRASDRERAKELDDRAMAGEGSAEDALESLRLIWPSYFADPDGARADAAAPDVGARPTRE